MNKVVKWLLDKPSRLENWSFIALVLFAIIQGFLALLVAIYGV